MQTPTPTALPPGPKLSDSRSSEADAKTEVTDTLRQLHATDMPNLEGFIAILSRMLEVLAAREQHA
jgi:hypothetical protein